MDIHDLPLSRRSALAAGAFAFGGVLAGCGGLARGSAADTPVRLGTFPTVTHAPGLLADADAHLARRLGEVGATHASRSFRAGPEVLQALLSGSLDVSYVGPNPTITAYARSRGDGVRVIAGATSGGASLVVRPGLTSASDLRGTRLATPQVGNTQDVALRHWLAGHGLRADAEGGGDVSIVPQSNAAAVQAFRAGAIDGGWLPEPFASRLVAAGGVVLVDEAALWPNGRFVTTHLVVRTAFLREHPSRARAVLAAHLDALDQLRTDPLRARARVSAHLAAVTGQALEPAVLEAAWSKLTFTPDPLAATLRATAAHADAVGLLVARPPDDFTRLWDLSLLNEALAARGETAVAA